MSQTPRAVILPPINKGYSQAGASLTKKSLRGFAVESGSPAEDINANAYTLRQRSRMLYMSAPIAAAALKRQRTNIVGAGLRLKATIDRDTLRMDKAKAEAWQRHTQAEFNLWASRKQACDATGVNNFYGMQQLVALAWPMSAMCSPSSSAPSRRRSCRTRCVCICSKPTACGTPDAIGHTGAYRDPFMTSLTTVHLPNGNIIYDGVEVDPAGAVVAYHVANTYPNQSDGALTEFTRVEAYGRETGLPNILHVMDAERPEQYRGVPYLAQAIEPLLQMRRYTEAEITAAMVQSFFTAFITTETPGEMILPEVGGDGVEEVSRHPNEYEMGPGTINNLYPGEDVKFGMPTHPNTGFDTFMRALCEQVGACLEIPADLLLMSFNSSYSASRAALLEAWKGFKMRREWLADDFCRPDL